MLAKPCQRVAALNKRKSRFGRLFDGWQAGIVVITMSLLVGLILVPRPQIPSEIPCPRPDMAMLKSMAAQDALLALEVKKAGLAFEVRQVGESFRRFGVAVAVGETVIAERLQGELQQQIRAVPDSDSLVRLRAYQTLDFLRELETFEATGVETRGLQELGGEFVRTARDAGWLVRKGSGERLLADDVTRAALFRKRWAETLTLHGPKFDATIDEERAVFAFLLRHPVVQISDERAMDMEYRCQAVNEYLLRKVTALGAVDSAYPTDFARGLLLQRLGKPQAAVEPLARFLDDYPDGPYTLHARNALRLAQARTFELLDFAPVVP